MNMCYWFLWSTHTNKGGLLKIKELQTHINYFANNAVLKSIPLYSQKIHGKKYIPSKIFQVNLQCLSFLKVLAVNLTEYLDGWEANDIELDPCRVLKVIVRKPWVSIQAKDTGLWVVPPKIIHANRGV